MLRVAILMLCTGIFFGCSSDSQNIEDKAFIEINSLSELLAISNELDSTTLAEVLFNYLDTLSQGPVIENDSQGYFVFEGSASSVGAAGDFNGWDPRNHSFTQLGRFDFWYRKFEFESDARLDYKLVLNDSNWILDPKNPNKIGGGFGPNSELAMPGYEQPVEVIKREDVSTGTLEVRTISSSNTGKTYKVHIYLPASYDEGKVYPAVYFQDGADYLTLAAASTVMDNLIADRSIEPMIGVFVEPTNRNVEYAGDDRFRYADFFVSELVPFVDTEYATSRLPDRRAVVGDSYGGNISAIIAFKYPEVFGNCGIHSGAFQANNFDTNLIVMDGEKKNIRVVSIWGTYEGSSLPPNMRRVRDYLSDKEYDLRWKELPEGHSWGLWRATIDDMLMFFFPAS